MSHQIDEVRSLLDRSVAVDAAVKALSLALEQPNKDPRFTLRGIEYKALLDKHGFSVTLHGVTLSSVYEQVLDRSADCPDIFGRVQLRLPGDGENPGEIILSLLIADTGDYSDDGTSHLGYSTYDVTGRPSDINRYRLSLAIAKSLQDTLHVLSPATPIPCDLTLTDSLDVA